jgi:hypothetical protein
MESTAEVSIIGDKYLCQSNRICTNSGNYSCAYFTFSTDTCFADICEKYLKTLLIGLSTIAQIIVTPVVSIFIGTGVNSRSKHYWD